jgi:hypothetical protein
MASSLMVQQSGGYLDDDDDRSSRTIRGRRVIFLEGIWYDNSETPLPSELRVLVHTITSVFRVWLHGDLIEEVVKAPGASLPDPELRNREIPQAEWDVDRFDETKKRKPASISRLLYMVAPDGEEFTYIHDTVGANIAVGELKEKIRNVRQWRGDPYLCPIVSFETKAMPTRFSTKPKPRPFFQIHEYRSFGKPAPAMSVIEHVPTTTTTTAATRTEKPTKVAEKSGPVDVQIIEGPSLREQMDDDIPSEGDAGATGRKAPASPSHQTAGRRTTKRGVTRIVRSK